MLRKKRWVQHNAVIGAHLEDGVLNYNQVNPAYLAKDGAALLTSPINSSAEIAAGITAPFPGFQQLWGKRATVAQALRSFPQYSTIDTAGGKGITVDTRHIMPVSSNWRGATRAG